MRVLLCHNHYQQPGGEDQVFRDERWLLESRGHDVVTYTRHNDAINQMSAYRAAVSAFWNDDTFVDVRRIIREHRPDVMHCTNTFPLISPSVYYAAKAEGVPVVQSLHNYRLLCANGYLLRNAAPCEDCHGKMFAWSGVRHACYRNSRAASAVVAGVQAVHRAVGTWRRCVDQYVTCSQFARQKFVSAGLPADRIAVKPNFVHPDTGTGDGRGGYAAFVGRLSPEKGIDVLLAAWRKLALPIALHIVGNGPLAGQIQEAARQDSRIQWHGWQPLEEVLRIVGDASMLIMPSIWYEIFGRTLVEGFSKGTPAIASNLGAMAELVQDGRTGFHFRPGDGDDLAAKVAHLWLDEDLGQSMRRTCREEFESHYTAEANYRQLMDIYAAAKERSPQTIASRPRGTRFTPSPASWPKKVNLFGVQVTPTTYADAVQVVVAAAKHRSPAVVSCHAAHAIVTSANDENLRSKVNRFEMVTPDGQPVRWALNWLHGAKLRDRVYGPELMLRLCDAAARENIGIYLYGGMAESLVQLQSRLLQRFPTLIISGSESPPFRPLTPEEDRAAIERINTSGAGLVFIGLGCPKQDHFAADHSDAIQAVQVCVGAAFDFHAGITAMAPPWMQRRGLEWLFRLYREPRRLWRRYLVTNTQFVLKLCRAFYRKWISDTSLSEEGESPLPRAPVQAT